MLKTRDISDEDSRSMTISSKGILYTREEGEWRRKVDVNTKLGGQSEQLKRHPVV